MKFPIKSHISFQYGGTLFGTRYIASVRGVNHNLCQPDIVVISRLRSSQTDKATGVHRPHLLYLLQYSGICNNTAFLKIFRPSPVKSKHRSIPLTHIRWPQLSKRPTNVTVGLGRWTYIRGPGAKEAMADPQLWALWRQHRLVLSQVLEG